MRHHHGSASCSTLPEKNASIPQHTQHTAAAVVAAAGVHGETCDLSDVAVCIARHRTKIVTSVGTQDDTKSSSKLGQIATANPLLALDDFVNGSARGGDDEDPGGDD